MLSPERALIFRITHVDNVAWVLSNGLHSRNSPSKQPNYREIGNRDLISKRAHHPVPVQPGGTLSDYIPFYFTPYSPMLYNIKTGYGGIQQVPLDDIVIFVTSLRKLVEKQIPFVFTDRHAYLSAAQFFNEIDRLEKVDWKILQARDFRRDAADLGKVERYQAEALVHRHLPCEGLQGIICRSKATLDKVQAEVSTAGVALSVVMKPGLYL